MFRDALLIFLLCLATPVLAGPADGFDGKWYFEEKFLLEFMPQQGQGDTPDAAEFRKNFLQNTYLSINTAKRQIKMVVFGEQTETDYFELVEQSAGMMKITPLDDNEETILKIDTAGNLELIEESGYIIRLSRHPSGQK